MSFDYEFLGRKLKEARESLMMEPSEAAEALNIPEVSYLEIERGDRKLSGDQLIILANLYRRDFRYFIQSDYRSAESQIKELFRKNSALSKLDRIAIQEFIRLCEHKYFLQNELNIIYPATPDYKSYRFSSKYFKKQGAELAVKERARFDLKDRPIQDIFKLIRKQGVHLFRRKLQDNNISGLYIRHPYAGHCILINYAEDQYRQNFSAAHEYCHVLIDSNIEQSITYYDKHDRIELRANSFARHFLVPLNGIKKEYYPATNYNEWVKLIRKIGNQFMVNGQVVVLQLEELGWLNKSFKEKLFNDQKIIIHRFEKYDQEIPQDLSLRTKERLSMIIKSGISMEFIALCRVAYEKGLITFQKVLEMLGLPYEEGIEILKEIYFFMEVS